MVLTGAWERVDCMGLPGAILMRSVYLLMLRDSCPVGNMI